MTHAIPLPCALVLHDNTNGLALPVAGLERDYTDVRYVWLTVRVQDGRAFHLDPTLSYADPVKAWRRFLEALDAGEPGILFGDGAVCVGEDGPDLDNPISLSLETPKV